MAWKPFTGFLKGSSIDIEEGTPGIILEVHEGKPSPYKIAWLPFCHMAIISWSKETDIVAR